MSRDDSVFYFQGLLFQNEIKHRVLQNENGPCPLLALINCMLLRGRFHMAIKSLSGTYPISFTALTQCLHEELQNVSDKIWEDGSDVSQAKMIAIAECVDLFPTLQYGLDINIKFDDVQSFDMKDRAHQVFDIYDLNIYHCWVMDRDGKYRDIYPLIADKTYDEVQDMLLNTESEHYALICHFLQNTKQQQTKYGVHRLYDTMQDNEIATLFHNNHYSTIYKHADDHLIYELVTDEGIVDEYGNAIWKTFNPSNYINGMDEIFVDSNFNALNQVGAQQLIKLRKIMKCLRKYKYDINETQDVQNIEHDSDDNSDSDDILLKKVENTLEFIDKFPFNPLECKMIFEEQHEIKDDLMSPSLIETELMKGPQTMKRALSDQVTTNHLGSIIGHKNTDEYKIRQCRVEDIAIICKEFAYLNHKALNERFWTKEFLTENTDRNGYVLEDHNSADIIGFILYERCEPLGVMHNAARIKPDQLLLRDLSASTSKDIDMDCKWKVTDWSSTSTQNGGKISFYSQFINITDIGIHPSFRKKGYGSKLLTSIIYSFPSGTRFAVEIDSANDSAIHCFGKCGFVIKRMENNRFYMTLVSDYNANEVVEFKKSSILKHDKKQIIKELKESRDKMELKAKEMEHKESKHDQDHDAHAEDEAIYCEIPQMNSLDEEKDCKQNYSDSDEDDDDDQKYDDEEVEMEKFDPEKLNRLCSELCCMEHSMLIECVLRIIQRVIDHVYERLDYDQIMNEMESACCDPYDNQYHEEKEKSKDNTKYIELALDILYCTGFVKRRFGDIESDRFYMSFANQNDIWKLEATHELIAKYQMNMHSKQTRFDLLKAITFDSNPSRHWKHIFDADGHGQAVRDRTVRLLKKICRGIIQNVHDLNHRSRNLNYESLFTKFDCEIPLLLLQKYGFEQIENLYKNEIRLVYRHKDIEPLKEMLAKIEYREKSMNEEDIFSSMPQRLQSLWIHVLSSIHGEKVRTITIKTIKRICTLIINEPSNPMHRELDAISLQNKFQCGTPLRLLLEYGFTQYFDPYRFDSQMRLRYDNSDITQCKQLLHVLEKGEKINVNILKNRDKAVAISVDQLRLMMALKALGDTQPLMDPYNGTAADLSINMTPLTWDGATRRSGALRGGSARNDDRILSAFDRNHNEDFKERDDGDREREMSYYEMTTFLGKIGLAKYAGNFINNGIKTKNQLSQFDVSLIAFFIDNKMDQSKFINWFKSNQQK